MQPGFEVRELRLADEASFREACAEVQAEVPTWDFSLGFDASISFSEYLRRLSAWKQGRELPAGFVPGGFYVGVVDGIVVGRLSVRFQLNEFLASVGGHIGYGVRRTQRRHGYATAMLRAALPICAAHGIKRALVTCNVDNLGSQTVIERCGGILENITCDPSLPTQKRRYWIPTS